MIFSKGKEGNVGEGPMAIDDESDKPINLNAPLDDQIIYTGDNVKIRRDHMEIVSPFENGLGTIDKYIIILIRKFASFSVRYPYLDAENSAYTK